MYNRIIIIPYLILGFYQITLQGRIVNALKAPLWSCRIDPAAVFRLIDINEYAFI